MRTSTAMYIIYSLTKELSVIYSTAMSSIVASKRGVALILLLSHALQLATTLAQANALMCASVMLRLSGTIIGNKIMG